MSCKLANWWMQPSLHKVGVRPTSWSEGATWINYKTSGLSADYTGLMQMQWGREACCATVNRGIKSCLVPDCSH